MVAAIRIKKAGILLWPTALLTLREYRPCYGVQNCVVS